MVFSKFRFSLVACLLLVACGSEAPKGPQFSPEDTSARGALVAKGKHLSNVLGCAGCHGQELTGEEWINEPEFAVLYSSNLTHAVQRYNDTEIEGILRTGVRPGGGDLWEMPSEAFAPLSAGDMKALLAYLRTLKPKGKDWPKLRLGSKGREEIANGKFKPTAVWVKEEGGKVPVDVGPTHARGRYLSHLACGECHTPTLGGKPEPFRPDLMVISAYSRADFETLMRKGIAVGGRDLPLMSGVARGRFSKLTNGELDAIYGYLQERAKRAESSPR